MPRYMIQFSYSTESVSNMVRNPQDRAAAARAALERLGGSLEAFYFTFGDYDGLAIGELPDNVSAVAGSMALSASGGFKAVKTTVLITPEESVEAMQKAGTLGFRPPGR